MHRAAGSRLEEANTLGNIGIVQFRRGAYDEAIASCERARAAHVAIGNAAGEANMGLNIGAVLFRRAAYDDAQRHFERSFALFESLGRPLGAANAMLNIGAIAVQRQKDDEALPCFERAIGLFTQAGERLGEAQAMVNIGTVHQHRGDHRRALEYFDQCRARFVELDDPLSEAEGLVAAAVSLQALGRLAEARGRAEESLAIAQRLSARIVVAMASGALALVADEESRALDGAARRAKRADAIRLAADAAAIYGELGNREEEERWENEERRMKSEE